MIDLKGIRNVALDIAGSGDSYERQDDLSECIWHLLERHYRVYLFTTEEAEQLENEDFSHERLTFLREDMPPSQALMKQHPQLASSDTLWVTDDSELQRWIHDTGAPFMYLKAAKAPPAGGQPLVRLSELTALLDPTALLQRDLVTMVGDLRRFRPEGALLVGIGGPPRSGYQDFALDLRTQLQDAGHELVELLDMSNLMRSTDAMLDTGTDAGQPWVSERAEHWLRDVLLAPLRDGRPVYEEALPEGLPADFEAHFPLYVSEASIVVLFGELLFAPLVAEALDIGILLEVSPEETTRRLYEIPAGEGFDDKFTAQYLSREGRIYQDYLQRNRVRERASLRIDANREGALVLAEEGVGPLV